VNTRELFVGKTRLMGVIGSSIVVGSPKLNETADNLKKRTLWQEEWWT